MGGSGRPERRLLVTGATGYIGSQLVGRLLEAGYLVRAMARDPAGLVGQPWLRRVEVAVADVLRPESLPPALAGVDTAYYLIHSMTGGHDFHQKDLQAARDFGRAARAAGLRRIIYLGALGQAGSELSPHLASRQATGAALREGGVPVTEFRAAVVVGAGSLSFEMVRYLTEHLPVMICPRWVYTRTQPIAVDNCLDYLVRALKQPLSVDRVVEIGGDEVLTYGDMMTGYAEVRGLRRWLLPVPVLTPRLSSYWVHLVTPISAEIAQPLIAGLRNEVVVRDDASRRLFPEIALLDYRSAVRMALRGLESPALGRPPAANGSRRLRWTRGQITEHRLQTTRASAESLYAAFTRVGGRWGWPSLNWAWRLRGAIDRLLGGVGLRRGTRPGGELQAGDLLDFWTVESVEPGRRLRLRADMKLPGQAWLEWEVLPLASGANQFSQTAIYVPKGLSGLLYWALLYPIHRLIFGRMHRRLLQLAQAIEATSGHPALGRHARP